MEYNGGMIAIIGAGELGRAVEKLLAENGTEVRLWDADPAKIPAGGPFVEKDVLGGVEGVLLCVPSGAVRGALAAALPLLLTDAFIVAFAKGLEKGSGKTTSELLDELAGHGMGAGANGTAAGRPHAVCGGPMLAEEILKGGRALGVFASRDGAVRDRLKELFTSPAFRVELSDDPPSIAWAGVLKNIYAVALGITDGLGGSGNEKGWIAARALREMSEVGAVLGADPAVIAGAAGAGDFLATGYSPYSRNREVGALVARDGKCPLASEGIASLPPLMARLGAKAPDFPLLNLVKEVGIDCAPAGPAFARLR